MRPNTDKDMTAYLIFQSTHPMRDATLYHLQQSARITHFNPRIPCGMRPNTALRFMKPDDFNPRIPCGMRRRQPIQRPQGIDFNPRIPCGMRRLLLASFRQSRYFNPRIPCGMRQTNAAMSRLTYEISIHASHAGCDRAYNKALTRNINFNPRIPCGMRRY